MVSGKHAEKPCDLGNPSQRQQSIEALVNYGIGLIEKDFGHVSRAECVGVGERH